MLPSLVATVYPMPAPPGDKFPLYFVAYLAVGIVWYAALRMKSSKVLDEIKADLEVIHGQYIEDAE